jgi:hypothetical protein
MEIRWKKLMVQAIVAAASEVLLGYAGLDNLANYCEFLSDKNAIAISAQVFRIS